MSPLSQNFYYGNVRNWKSMLYFKEKEREPFKTLTLAEHRKTQIWPKPWNYLYKKPMKEQRYKLYYFDNKIPQTLLLKRSWEGEYPELKQCFLLTAAAIYRWGRWRAWGFRFSKGIRNESNGVRKPPVWSRFVELYLVHMK